MSRTMPAARGLASASPIPQIARMDTPLSSSAIAPAPRPRRVFLLGATGTIGRATLRALIRRGHEVVCFVRPRARAGLERAATRSLLAGATVRFGDVADPQSLARDGFRGERFDALVSCMASRTGAPKDAWAIDYQAHVERARGGTEGGGDPIRPALGHLCPKAGAGVSTCEAGIREGPDRFRPGLLDRASRPRSSSRCRDRSSG